MTVTRSHDHVGFRLPLSSIRHGIFLPKYYDPELAAHVAGLEATHTLVRLGDLIAAGHIEVSTGDEIGKMAYGTGSIPFVRTSDISNWEIKTDAKQGVSEDIYLQYASSQDVRSGDIFFVRDGTYLIGQVALVMESDLPLLYQSHLLKFRVLKDSPISRYVMMACLTAPIVKAQIQSKQFTADIIDTVGDRYEEIVLPVPTEGATIDRIESEVSQLVVERSRLRDKLRKIPSWAGGDIRDLASPLPNAAADETTTSGNTGFTRRWSSIANGVFVPKYYDPTLRSNLQRYSKSHRLVPLVNLVSDGVISWQTGIEVGKMAYGTGDIPFVRTSDISNWELKVDPKQSVSEQICADAAQDVRANDILLVRDGTYLVGTSCILTQQDTRILFCGGLYKFRVEKPDVLGPHLLLALLNAPIVRRQMRAKQFTRDIIDTLGKRIFEVLLPLPKDAGLAAAIAAETRSVIETRARLRDRAREIALELEATSPDYATFRASRKSR